MSSIATHNNSAMHPSANARPEVVPGNAAYLVKVGIGELEDEYWLIFDTGSDLTWIQCKPCLSCYDQVDPIFNPKVSYPLFKSNQYSSSSSPIAIFTMYIELFGTTSG
ncbi:hypothetical protein Dsin_022425 [Dipteronia sinensis]|uniref:Peptidase A1 domain-containing protein n=1 Tax=Dipteronia sinensis TaxID=43782 RepID=A0AAE0A1X5_9ROSI|nr:hypothetical protein Dsin_022425 [Dipteronia sinensis]